MRDIATSGLLADFLFGFGALFARPAASSSSQLAGQCCMRR